MVADTHRTRCPGGPTGRPVGKRWMFIDGDTMNNPQTDLSWWHSRARDRSVTPRTRCSGGATGRSSRPGGKSSREVFCDLESIQSGAFANLIVGEEEIDPVEASAARGAEAP